MRSRTPDLQIRQSKNCADPSSIRDNSITVESMSRRSDEIDSREIKGKDLAMELPAYGYEWVRLRRNQEQEKSVVHAAAVLVISHLALASSWRPPIRSGSRVFLDKTKRGATTYGGAHFRDSNKRFFFFG
jgi:hypothetical protein